MRPSAVDSGARDAVLVYGSSRDFSAFKLYAFKRYQDHRPYLEMERQYVDRQLERMLR